MEQWRLAMISFKMWGEMSPMKEVPPETGSSDSDLAAKKKDDDFQETQRQPSEEEVRKVEQTVTPKRSIGQAELESAYFKVRVSFN
jgi:hypothetical protein